MEKENSAKFLGEPCATFCARLWECADSCCHQEAGLASLSVNITTEKKVRTLTNIKALFIFIGCGMVICIDFIVEFIL